MKQIVLVGLPNSGKTSLFNWLTGFQNKTINYGGSTVRLCTGPLQKKYSFPACVIDTPGIYSFQPLTDDEKLTCEYLQACKKDSLIIYVLDLTKLETSLALLKQLNEQGFSIVVALSMQDLADKNFDLDKFKQMTGLPCASLNSLLGEGVPGLVNEIQQNTKDQFNKKIKFSAKEIRQACLSLNQQNPFLSSKIDRLLLHPQLGIMFFSIIMFMLFSSIFWLAEPFMNFIDSTFGFFIDKIKTLYPSSFIADFIGHGILTSLGGVLVFVPQIFILFVGISLLEDTGYLARGVALADGPFSKFGLSGRSFIPFLSGYACAIPAALLVRNLTCKKEKLLAYFALPFMSCSARLPVYTLLFGFLFYNRASWQAGLGLTTVYIMSLFLGLGACFILNKLIGKGKETSSFVVELPIYRKPVFSKIFYHAYLQTKHYVVKAGPAIFTLALIIWAATTFPKDISWDPSYQLQNSYAAQLGQWIEPVFSQFGMDWRVGVALIAAFAAREVFVSALALLFVADNLQAGLTQSLIGQMHKAVNSEGEMIFTTASVLALICFFMFSLQCLSTTAVIYKESRSLKLAASQLVILNVLAYILAVAVYQSVNWLT